MDRRTGTNTRSLRRHFAKYLGLGPKQLARMARVQLAMCALVPIPDLSPKLYASQVGSMHNSALAQWIGMATACREKVHPKVVRFQ